MLRSSSPDRPEPAGAAGPTAGFTVLEVMVALAIALPALALLYREGALAVAATRAASAYEEAVSRAQSRLDALAVGPLAPGEREGDDGGSYRWRTRIATVGTAGPLGGGGGGTSLYAVTVELSWPGPAGDRRHVVLDTLQLGASPPNQAASRP